MNSESSASSLSKIQQKELLKPKFLGSRVSSLEALAGLLDVNLDDLKKLAETSDSFYHLHEKTEKPDGSVRYKYSVREPLKSVLKKVNQCFSQRCKYPDYLTGSLPGWSYSKNAALHAGKGTVICIDATNFFPSIGQDHVKKVWLDFYQFDESVAELLAKLCCYQGALAQGSPTSPYLANLAFWDIEPLIVKEFQSRGYDYSRYVDDICVSSTRKLSQEEKTWAILAAKKVFLSKKLKVKNRKTKVMDRNKRQEVNKRTVNAGRVCASRELKYELRAKVKRFRDAVASGTKPEIPFEKQYQSIRGKLFHFRQFNKTAADKMLEQLERAFGAH